MADTNTVLHDRAAGCLVGAALGDAFGMPLEFGPARNPPVREFMAGRLAAGTFTDDTEMALALADSLVAKFPLDANDLVLRFLDWYNRRPDDVGNQTAAILSLVRGGMPWEAAAMDVQYGNPNSMPNGSVMRCFPVSLAYHSDLDSCIAASRLQSQVTHPHKECQMACVFVNAFIWHALHGSDKTQAFEAALQDTQADMPGALKQAILAAPSLNANQLPNSGWVRHCVESAVWGVLTTDNYTEAVIRVANLGHDADTSAAVTGAMAGAVYGLHGIPADWQEILHGAWPIHSNTILQTPDFIKLAGSLLQAGA